MKNSFKIGFIILFAFFSCEKEIDIDLNDADQQIVVEGVCKSLEGKSYVLLSKTINSYDSSGGLEKLSAATVQVSDDDGNTFLFEEDLLQPGRYRHPTFAGMPNTDYEIAIDYEGVSLSGKTRTLTVPQIDSLFVVVDPGLVGDDTSNVLIYTVTDNAVEKNYYRFVLWINGERDKNINIETDDLGNGETYTSPFFGIDFESEDTVYAELWSMSKQNYDYFSALFTNLNQGPFSAAPSDPPSNIENGIGYFGVFMVDTMSIIIP